MTEINGQARDEDAIGLVRADPDGYFARRRGDVQARMDGLKYALVDNRSGHPTFCWTEDAALDSATRNHSVYRVQITILEKVQ
jgi:hypothetical protein